MGYTVFCYRRHLLMIELVCEFSVCGGIYFSRIYSNNMIIMFYIKFTFVFREMQSGVSALKMYLDTMQILYENTPYIANPGIHQPASQTKYYQYIVKDLSVYLLDHLIHSSEVTVILNLGLVNAMYFFIHLLHIYIWVFQIFLVLIQLQKKSELLDLSWFVCIFSAYEDFLNLLPTWYFWIELLSHLIEK